jgi:hypothetical protein
MTQIPAKSQVKLNRRGLTELVLGCAFLALSTFALWTWQNNGYVAAMDNSAAGGEVPLLSVIMRHPAIMFSTVVTEFILLLALTLALVPISWWLRTDYLIASEGARLMTPLRWVGDKLRFTRAPKENAEGQVPGEYVLTPTGERVFVPQPDPEAGVAGEQEVVMVAQPDGTVVAMVQQPDGTMVPAETKPADGQSESTELLLPTVEQAPSDVLNFEEEEEDPLADLADIGDILSSAFDEDSAIDPEREAISRSLDDVDIMALARSARHVLATFQQ